MYGIKYDVKVVFISNSKTYTAHFGDSDISEVMDGVCEWLDHPGLVELTISSDIELMKFTK